MGRLKKSQAITVVGYLSLNDLKDVVRELEKIGAGPETAITIEYIDDDFRSTTTFAFKEDD